MVSNDKEKPLFSKFSKVDQIGIAVKDMETTMKFYEKMFGIEPFPTVESAVDSAKLKIGLFQLGEVQIELIQVLEGETTHSKFLEKRGEGLHHLGFFVEDIEKELARLEKGGIKVLERGTVLGVVKFAYLDTENILGVVLELIQLD
ncbi:MAG: VOC family protein [Candidatus Bathyarchaeota archaeon]|nr:VOC family protein [Candidatus Bathyarchaeota archaeon]